MPIRLRTSAAACVLALLLVVVRAAPAADRDRLLFHAETLEGAVLESRGADTPFNPASLIKVGTSLWALERLGDVLDLLIGIPVTRRRWTAIPGTKNLSMSGKRP